MDACLDETISTLKFVEKARQMTTKPVRKAKRRMEKKASERNPHLSPAEKRPERWLEQKALERKMRLSLASSEVGDRTPVERRR